MNDPREWLETDGLGGYAMGTADGVRTRRYHGLLIAAVRPPCERVVLVADVETWLETAHGTWALSSHRYAGDVVHPDGASRVARFAAAPWPTREHALPDGTRVIEELVLTHGASSLPWLIVRWRRIAGDGPARLHVRPMLAGRDHHALMHENPVFDFSPHDQVASNTTTRVTWRPYPGVPSVTAIASGAYRHAPDWYRRFRYREEAARGLDADEDLASPGRFELELAGGDAVLAFGCGDRAIAAAADRDARALADRGFASESARRAGFASPLHRAADAYIVARGDGATVIAGYPWFTDWGRDTFISLRGLCLAGHRIDDARKMLLAWTGVLSGGMLPNRFAEGDTPEYNAVDASLWFVIAADALAAIPGAIDLAERKALDDTIDAIVAGYAAGTRHRIAVDPDDGLVRAGEPGLQLTWMDAKVGDHVITPRIGKPVEIQALWANALAIAGRRTPRWRDLLARTRASFVARFWDPDRAQLHDVVDVDHVAGTVDRSARPNQIFAVGGLTLALLDGERARAVVDATERLWTPAGLRSLAPGEPGYVGHYHGAPAERDGAYHQGTVWTWLAGPFIEAWVRVRGDTPEARRDARRRFLDPVLARTDLLGFGHLAEIADGDPPHTPGGCPFQAWSVAEALRLDALLA